MVKQVFFGSLLILFAGWFGSAVAAELTDPLRPYGYNTTPAAVRQQQQVKTSDWRLAAVLIAADRTVAVINGRSLQVGDMLEGYTLTKITPSSALLQKNDQQVTLRRSGTGLKKMSESQDVIEGSQP